MTLVAIIERYIKTNFIVIYNNTCTQFKFEIKTNSLNAECIIFKYILISSCTRGVIMLTMM